MQVYYPLSYFRRFLIKARQNRNAFSSDVKFESVSQGGTEGVNFDHNEIYEGVLEGTYVCTYVYYLNI